MPELTRVDIRILNIVQESSDITLDQLAQRVALSPSQCSRRLQQLKEQGYITRTAAMLDPAQLGLGLKAYVTVAIRRQGKRSDAFHELIRRSSEVLECSRIAGDMDYILKIWTKDLKTFRTFLNSLADTNQVARTRSSIVVDDTKNTTALSIDYALKKDS